MVSSRLVSNCDCLDSELVGRWVKIVSKTSKHFGRFAKVVGLCKGDLRCIRVYVRETDCKFNICRDSVELVN